MSQPWFLVALLVVTLAGAAVIIGAIRLLWPERYRAMRGTPEDRARVRPVAFGAILAGTAAIAGGGDLLEGAVPRSFGAWLLVALPTVAGAAVGMAAWHAWASRTFGEGWGRSVDLNHPLPAGARSDRVKFVAGFVAIMVLVVIVSQAAADHIIF